VTGTAAETGVATWSVEIPLPIGADWMNLNKPPRHRGEQIRRNALKKNLRRLAFDALADAHVQQELGRVRVQVELRFVDRRTRDVSNFEPTIKPIIDALQPTRKYRREVTTKIGGRTVKVPEIVTEWGWGVIAGDDRRYLDRPEPIIGEPIGRGTGRKGVVILHITPLVPELIDNPEDDE
jgi:hypothetical protein